MRRVNSLVASAALCFASLAAFGALAQEPAGNEQAMEPFPRVRIETTAGAFTLELFALEAPLTVTQFLRLAASRFYEGAIFHRVVKDFVIQGGGFSVDFQERAVEQALPNESGNGRSNVRGAIAMARTGDPHSAKNQFYINLSDNVALDPRPGRWGYAVFGQVVGGMDVVDDIGNRATGPGGRFDRDVPAAPVIIERVLRVNQ
ncbi:MAG: peptidylprolyl isomerase [Gammaproteobacteria bacterium]|nr:peptidylprolyl isomerase [Gammaproteobacteria bacterium]